MFFDPHVAGFASTHSKTRNSDVIWCRKHDRRDDGSMSTLMTKLLWKQWIITIRPLVSDCTIGYNFSVSCNTRLKSCRTIQSHSIYVSAKIHFDTFYSKQDIAVGIFHVRNNHFLTNQMFFDYPVASFSSTHSKTRQSDVIGCREHRIRDHGSISTLLTKLLKTLTLRYRCRYLPCTEQSLLTNQMFFDPHVAGFASTHSKTRHSDVIWCHKHDRRDDGSKLVRKQLIIDLSQIVRSAITSVFLAIPGSNLVGRYSLTPYASLQKFISIPFIVNKISLLVSSTYGTITFWPLRCFSITLSLLFHQHIRKHDSRM